MKAKLIFALAIVMLPICSFNSVSKALSSSGNIHVVVQGIGKLKGQVGILLFQEEEGFPTDHTKAMKQVLIPIKNTEISYSFRDLPYGKYAISIMHDVNMNDVLDTNFLGIPKEGIGVSNNAKGTLSAPKFKDACFTLDETNMTQTIEMNY